MAWTAVYKGEEIEVEYEATPELVDFGVPNSPKWYEPTDVLVRSVTVLGIEATFESFSKQLQDELYALHREVEWPLI